MGAKWSVTKAGALMVAAVAKGMAAANGGMSEGMQLKEINGESVQDLRDSGLALLPRDPLEAFALPLPPRLSS